jgi:hypothetical protein
MNKKEVEALAREAAKGIKTEQDLNDFSRMLKKVTVEAALDVHLSQHFRFISKLNFTLVDLYMILILFPCASAH